MSEMVERVARALCVDAHSGRLSPDAIMTCGPRSEIGKPAWRLFEDRARVAIAAMREPTEAMVDAQMRKVGYLQSSPDGYRAMIDEALREPLVEKTHGSLLPGSGDLPDGDPGLLR
jgi:hypothetical protein